jgi:steroid delta-isomerase-like uncharacterized protein
MSIEILKAYSQAWNDHNIDAIMAFMSDDCVFLTGGGSEHYGTKHEGFDEVKARFIEVWESIPDVRFVQDQHFAQGNRGCSQWVFTGTSGDGQAIEISGVDLFTFKDGKVSIKDSYIKNRS